MESGGCYLYLALHLKVCKHEGVVHLGTIPPPEPSSCQHPGGVLP